MRASNKHFKNLSRQLIVEALLELMKEKPYQEISITEITKRADIARRTFYVNFNSKDEVLQEYIEILVKRFEEKSVEKNTNTPQENVAVYFECWKEEIEFLTLLRENHLFMSILEQYNKVIYKKVDEISPNMEKDIKTYLIAFNAAGLWSLLHMWVKNGMKETPEEMAQIYMTLISYNSSKEMKTTL